MSSSSSVNFDLSLKYVLANEGGFVNDPFDHGGATNFGITQDTLSRYLGRSASVDEVKAVSPDVVAAIYRAGYWNPVHGDEMVHQGIATALFDVGVNRGPSRSVKYAQMVVGCRGDAVNGHMTSAVVQMIKREDPRVFIEDFHELVLEGYKSIVGKSPTQRKFLKGWTRRANRLLTLI